MKKNTDKLISLAFAVLALWGAYAILVRNPKPTDNKASADTEITLTKHENQDISSVNVNFSSGKSFSVNVKPDGETFSYELVGGIDGLSYNSNKLEALVNAAASLTVKEIEKNRDKVNDYGLDASAEQVVINYSDGKKDTVTLGLDNGKLGTYMLYNDDPKIYLLNNDKASQMKYTLEEYRSLAVISGISEISGEINRLYIERFGPVGKGKPFEVIRRPVGELSEEKASYYSAFVMKSPRQADAVDDSIVEKILLPLSASFNATEIVEDFPKDLRPYGLDKSLKIDIETENVKQTLLVGSENEGERFVMIQGGNTVFKVMKDAFNFLDDDYRDYCTAILWTHNINDVQKMTVQYDDELFETVLKHGENNTLIAETNGKATDEQKARKLFAQIISVRMEDELDAPAKQTDIKAKLMLTYTDGKAYEISFIKGASRQFIASVNGGKYIYVVNSSELDEIMAFYQ